jgi:hypothetical protein
MVFDPFDEFVCVSGGVARRGGRECCVKLLAVLAVA